MTKSQERRHDLSEASTPSAKRRERQRERRTAHEVLHSVVEVCKTHLMALELNSDVLRLQDRIDH